MALPTNVERAFQFLLSCGGSAAVHEVVEHLGANGIHVGTAQVARYPDRFPEHFRVAAEDRIEATLLTPTSPETGDFEEHDSDDDPPADAWWASPLSTPPLLHASIAVVDIETTGLDPAVDEILEISACNLATGERIDLVVDAEGASGGRADALTPTEALAELRGWLEPYEAVCGHLVGAFDLPFLRSWSDRAGTEPLPDLAVLDTHLLSLIVDPSLDGRSLGELCEWLEITHGGPHVAAHDVDATRAVALELMKRFDSSTPSFALAHRLMAEAGDPWARVISSGTAPSQLDGVLAATPDPLVAPTGMPAAKTARGALAPAFDLLATRKGHRERASQRRMSADVAHVLDDGGRLLVEAPTGTGKSLAYLIPAIGRAAYHPVVIATHTKVLQRQLHDDAAMLREQGLLTIPYRQLQGVSNYLCVREIAETIELRDITGSAWLAVAVAVRALDASPGGVWDDVTDPVRRRGDGRYASARATLATTSAACERRNCEWAEQCPMMQRLDDIVKRPGIIAANHALVAHWLTDEPAAAPAGMFDSVPTALILDEAHTVEDSMASAWAGRVGARSLRRLVSWGFHRQGPVAAAKRAARATGADNNIHDAIADYGRSIGGVYDALGEAVEDFLHNFGGSAGSVNVLPKHAHLPEFRAMQAQLVRTSKMLDGLASLLGAAKAQLSARLHDEPSSGERRLGGTTASVAARRVDRLIAGYLSDLGEASEWLMFLANIAEPHLWVHVLTSQDDWVGSPREGSPPAVRDTWGFEATPIEIASRFAAHVVDRCHSIVLTSATLRVSDRFDFIASRLGLDLEGPGAFEIESLPSPFDYEQQARLILTSHLPVPTPVHEREFVEEVAADQVGFLSLSRGRAMTLFAARTRMDAVAELVDRKAPQLAERGVSLLVQHRESAAEIRHRFRSDEGTAAFGLRSYWEGFDAPGDTLSYLFIEKPPYPHPGDPLSEARQRVIEDRGGDPFGEYVVPQTAIRLAQGFGRLIRTESDRGVAYIYDRRIRQPRGSNEALLSAIPVSTPIFAEDRDQAWTAGIEFVTGEAPDLADAIILIANTTDALLEELRLLPGEDPDLKLAQAAKAIFGIDELHPSQLAIMRAVLAGHDTLGFMPTGRGKSLCFQLPALLHPNQSPFVVVSPLVALIKDQVDELRSRRGLRSIVGITGRTSRAEQTEALRDLATGKVRLLYLSPERLVRDPTLQSALAQVELGALVVDEAHCISSWGHDFRPEFRQIAPAVKQFRRSPRVGLTATATEVVQQDIATTLELNDPVTVREPTDRADLAYWSQRCGNERDRTRELLRFVEAQNGAPGIVYASRRATTEQIAWVLRQAGYLARSYHAGMIPEQRETVQDDFLAGNVNIIVATKAFGMGINKSDIGWVVHVDLPEALESYAQEAGRAARAPDLTATVALLWSRGDIARRKGQIGGDAPFTNPVTAERLLQAFRAAPRRGSDSIVEADALAENLGVEADALNVLTAWLEESGALVRKPDCMLRGHVTLGRQEPVDAEERMAFVDLTKRVLKCRIGVRRLMNISEIADAAQLSPDDLEKRLTDWSLSRYVTFQGTQRAWRVEVVGNLDRARFDRVVAQWRRLQAQRLDSMIAYAQGRECRRVLIARQFGDLERTCAEAAALLCDVCATDAPPWHTVPIERVPDPESFVDTRLVVLQAVAWSSRNTERPFGEGTVKAVVLGQETIAERPISPAALRCPQFGALRHVRGGARRWDDALKELIECGQVERFETTGSERSWASLRVTDDGRMAVGGRG